jgi:aspartate racemase
VRAEFGLLASNTPHVVFAELQQRARLPLLSLVEAACVATQALGLKRVGLIGTRFTRQGSFYPGVFGRAGVELVTPNLDEQILIHDRYVGELIHGVFLPETAARVREIIEGFQAREGIDGLILGGTELPLLLRSGPAPAIPYLDTTRLHVERVVTEMLS